MPKVDHGARDGGGRGRDRAVMLIVQINTRECDRKVVGGDGWTRTPPSRPCPHSLGETPGE